MKSNINILSNIYMRTDEPLFKDTVFLKQVRGRKALLNLSPPNATNVKLTQAQIQQRDTPTVCSHKCNVNKEQTYGVVVVNNQDEISCRCEHSDCQNYDKCMLQPYSKIITRTQKPQKDVTIVEKQELEFDLLGSDLQNPEIDDIFALLNPPKEDTLPQKVNIEPENKIEEDIIDDNIYEELDSPQVLIESKITEKIMVNSASGTGKTYTLIKRLEYIILNNSVDDLKNILVLCSTKNNKQFIEDAILEKVLSKEFPIEAKDIFISTISFFSDNYFNSFEENETDSIDEKLKNVIELCNEKNLSNIEYFMLDELQDFVNYKAFIVLNILKSIKCGYLLLGDNVQAIYDYSAYDVDYFLINSNKFYNMLSKELSSDLKKYEFKENIRQKSNDKLSTLSSNIREALITQNEPNRIIEKEFEAFEVERIEVEKFIPTINEGEKVLILCKNNGEVEWVSTALHKNKINHTVYRNEQTREFSKFIALVLWDYYNDIIEQDLFLMRYMDRVNNDRNEALTLFNSLLKFSKSSNDEIDTEQNFIIKKELIEAIESPKEIPKELSASKDCNLIVSLIDNSKGLEVDNVYLSVIKPTELAKENKLAYVAVTRAKKEFTLVNFAKSLNFIYPKCNSFRVANLSSTYRKCQYISFGDDIDNKSFVTGDYLDIVLAQEYINNINIHDEVELILEKNNYIVYHIKLIGQETSRKIGEINQSALEDIQNIVDYKKKSYVSMPKRISGIYISNIITIPPNIIHENTTNQSNSFEFLLGVKISGFASLDWKY